MKRGCLSPYMCITFVCVWLYRGCMTLHDFYGLWSDLEYHFDWKTEDDTQTHSWFPPMWYVYQQARSGIPFHQNKSQLSDRATFDNVTLLLPTCTFQPTLIWHSPPFTSPQNPFHPFLHLFLCSVSSRCFWAGQWHRPVLPFACILPQLWQKLSWLTDAFKKDKQLEHLASETSCLQDLPTQREIESHLKIELSFCNKELQGCTSYQHRLKSQMQDEKNPKTSSAFSFPFIPCIF